MKKILMVLSIIGFLGACQKIQYSNYRITVFNTSSSEILLEYETIEEKGELVLHNDIYEVGYNKTLYVTSLIEDNMPKYTKDDFEEKIFSIKISVINGTDTIPLSKDFAPFENWEYWDHLDDQIMTHDYRINITDDLID